MDFCYFPTEGYIYWACQRSETADLASFQHFATWWIRCSGWTRLWYEISRRTKGTWVHNIHLIDAVYEDLIKYLRGGQFRPWHRWCRVKSQSQIYLNPHPPTFCSSTKFPDYRLRPEQAHFKHQSFVDVFLMCEIIRTRQGWAGTLGLAALYLFQALAKRNQIQKMPINACGDTEDADKSGVMMIDLSVIMMTLVVMKSVKAVIVVIMSTAFVFACTQAWSWSSEQLLFDLKKQGKLVRKCFRAFPATFCVVSLFILIFNISFLHFVFDILTMPTETDIMTRRVFLSLKVKENKPLFTAIQMDSHNLNPIWWPI